jgi:hypothetical protein
MKNSIPHYFRQHSGSPLAVGLRWLALVFVLFQAVVAVTATTGTTTCQVSFGSAVAYVTGAPSSGYCTNSVININGGGASVQLTTATPSTSITDWNALAACDPLGAPPQAGSLTLTPCAVGGVPAETTTTAAPTTTTVVSTTTTTITSGVANCQVSVGSAVAYVTGAPTVGYCTAGVLNVDGGGATTSVAPAVFLIGKTQLSWGSLSACDPLGAPPAAGAVTLTPCMQSTPVVTTTSAILHTTTTTASTTSTTVIYNSWATCQVQFGSAIGYVTGVPTGSYCASSMVNVDGGGATVSVATGSVLPGSIQVPWASLLACSPLGAPPAAGATTLTPCAQNGALSTTTTTSSTTATTTTTTLPMGPATCQLTYGSAVAYVTGAPSSASCSSTILNLNGGGASVVATTAPVLVGKTQVDWGNLASCDPLGAPPAPGTVTFTPCYQGLPPVTTLLSQTINFGSAPVLAVGGTGTLSATGGASGNAVTFTSTTPLVCSVSGNSVTALSAGSCIVAANQLGNANYTAAPQATQTLTVNKISQTVNFGSAPILTVGGTGTLSAVGGASNNPVTFTSTTFSVCTVSGTIVTGVSVGSCVLKADQAGNSNYLAAPQATQTIAVSAGPQSINLGLAPSVVVGGTGTLSAAGGASNNPVTFTSTTSGVCTVTGNIVTGVSVGSCVLKADQAGNSNYLAAPQATQTIAVSAGPQSINLGLAPSVVVGGTGNLSATGGNSGNPVTFSSISLNICTVTNNVVTGVAAGSCVLKADQAGNSNYLAAPQTSQTITVAKGSQVITFGSTPILAVDGAGTLSASGGASGIPVVFTSNTPSVCSVVNTTVAGLTAGSCVVAANQTGNTNYNAAPTATQTIAVAKGSQSISFGAAPILLLNGTGSVSATGGASNSPIVFTSNSSTICTVSGSTVSALVAGDCVVAANQAGNGNYNAAAQATQTITIVNSLELLRGWNLLGNSTDQVVAVNSALANTVVTSVWKWDSSNRVWQFYSPKLTAAELQVYCDSKGYGVLSTINPGEGFWVDAKLDSTLPGLPGAPFYLEGAQLVAGWNLVTTADKVFPAKFNLTGFGTPPTIGVPINLTSLWAWNNLKGQWYFYSPKLEGLGGTALADYTTAKNYLDFNAESKKLGQGMGFWVDKP